MKRIAHFISVVLLLGAAACGRSNSPEQETVPEQQITDTAAAPVAAEAGDTTLQPKVTVTLLATGNTPEEMAFDQDTIIVPQNALINLKLVNEADDLNAIHNFVLVSGGKYKEVGIAGAEVGSSSNYIPESKAIFAATPLALPGQTIEYEFEAPPPGTYDFVCTYPDHWKTMHGKLIVK